MRAMVLEKAGEALRLSERPDPVPAAHQLLIEVCACAVCRTDLHVVDGDLTHPKLPLVPGHEIVGRVLEVGRSVQAGFKVGQRVGVPWLGFTCGTCSYCTSGQENLCDTARFTGYQIDGGFATHTVADARYCFAIPDRYDDVHAAPLLCAGLIGYRTLKAAGEARSVGIYGFGAAAHIVAQICRHQGRAIYAFTRDGDTAAQDFARDLGCTWAGSSLAAAPVPLDAALVFAPVGELVPLGLRALRKGGTLVLGGIHMSTIPAMPYDILWGERAVRSIANLTRKDGGDFMKLAAEVPLEIHSEPFALDDANIALDRLRAGQLTGAAVLVPSQTRKDVDPGQLAKRVGPA